MPYHDALQDALEFEVLVARGARRGRLALQELCESYSALASALRLDTAEPDALGIDSLTEALCHLPEGFSQAQKLIAVCSMQDFSLSVVPMGDGCEEHANGDTKSQAQTPFAAAWLDCQTLLVACPEGLCSLNALLMALCALAHEGSKWRRLQADCLPFESATKPHSEQTDMQLALTAGVSLSAWQKANALAGGQLSALLTGQSLPDVTVHAKMTPQRLINAANTAAQRIVSAIAEAGFLRRPVHLWLGPPGVVDILSPYARDLGPQLLAWARLQKMPHAQEDIYAAMAAFTSMQPQLEGERRAAETACGIQRLKIDTQLLGAVDIVDFARLDIAACDPALTHLKEAQKQAPAPILLRLPPALGQPMASLFDTLTAALGDQLASVTVIAPGFWQSVETSMLAVARMLLPWDQSAPAVLAPPDAPDKAMAKLASIDTFIDVPMPQASCPKALIDALVHRSAGVSFGQMPLACALMRLCATRLSKDQPLNAAWFIARSQAQNTAAQAPVACDRLDAVCRSATTTQAPKASSAPRPGGLRLRV